MKRLFRAGLLLAVLALILAVVPGAFAQEETFGLSADDFALWGEANENSAGFDTLSMSYTSTLNVAGLAPTAVTWDISGVAQFGENGALSMTAVGTLNDGTQDVPVDFEVRLVDDMVFFNLGDGNGWAGGPAADVMGGLGGAFAEGAGLPVDPADLAAGDLSGLMDDEATMGALMALGSIDPANFISLVRGDADGMATVTIDISISELLQDPAVAGLLGGAMMGGASSDAAPTPSPDELQMMGAMLGGMFSEAVLTYTQTIDTEAKLVRMGDFNFSLPLAALGMGEDAAVGLTLGFSFDAFNEAVTVEAPAEFTELDMGS